MEKMKSLLASIKQAVANKALKATVALGAYAYTAVSNAAPDASAVNTEAGVISTFIHGILEGDVGYLFTLLMFVLGIVAFIQTKKWEAMLGCFAIGLAVIIVPGALQGFFDVSF